MAKNTKNKFKIKIIEPLSENYVNGSEYLKNTIPLYHRICDQYAN